MKKLTIYNLINPNKISLRIFFYTHIDVNVNVNVL